MSFIPRQLKSLIPVDLHSDSELTMVAHVCKIKADEGLSRIRLGSGRQASGHCTVDHPDVRADKSDRVRSSRFTREAGRAVHFASPIGQPATLASAIVEFMDRLDSPRQWQYCLSRGAGGLRRGKRHGCTLIIAQPPLKSY